MNSKGLKSIIFSIISPLFSSKPVKINVILKNGDEIPILGGLRILSTPDIHRITFPFIQERLEYYLVEILSGNK